MTLRCFQDFIGPRTSASSQQLGQVTAHSLHQGRKVVYPKKITGLWPGVQRQMKKTSFRAALLRAKNSHSWQAVHYRGEATSGLRRPGMEGKKANTPELD